MGGNALLYSVDFEKINENEIVTCKVLVNYKVLKTSVNAMGTLLL